jgi:hypothetical protein
LLFAEDDVDSLALRVGFQSVEFDGTHAQKLHGFVHGDVVKWNVRYDDAAELFVEIRDAGGDSRATGGSFRGHQCLIAQFLAGDAEAVLVSEVAAAEGLGEEGGFGFGAGGLGLPAELEFSGDGVAGGGDGLGEQGLFGGVEALPGMGAQIGC